MPTEAPAKTFSAEAVRYLASRPTMPEEDAHVLENPPEAVQLRFVGASYESAYERAADFLNLAWKIAAEQGVRLGKGSRVLDYGCGWGRMLRVVRATESCKDIRLYGTDILEMPLELCRRSIPNVSLSLCGVDPPSDYRDGLFDLIYAFSVFSHLPEDIHLKWAKEFHRILRPGGVVVSTTQSRGFFKVCEEYRDGTRERLSDWHEVLANAFGDPSSVERYDRGELVFAPMGPPGNYGEAVVPETFVRREWGALGFDLVEWILNEGPTVQTVFALVKR